jgi:competence protein ComEC
MDSGENLVNAILYGKLEGLSPETIFLYSRTGLIHLFSASGFHMSAALFLSGLASRLGEPLLPKPCRRFLLFFLSLAMMAFFGAKTDWSSPLVRAFAFTTLLLGARLWEKRPSRLRVFLLSLLAAWAAGRGSTLSFLLSAAGMAGVLWGGGKNLFTMALGPWLFTLPLVAWCFGLFSLAAPLWNLSFGLLVSATVLPLAITDLVIRAIVPWNGLFRLAARLMEGFHQGLRLLDWDVSFWVEGRSFALVAALLLAATLLPRYRRSATALIALGALFLPAPKLAALNVGQGDGIFLRLSSGASLLVDGGPPSRHGDAFVNRSLERLGVGAVDHLLLTHPDRDHLGGLPSLLSRHRAGALWIREAHLRDPRLLPLLAAAERSGTPVRFLTRAQQPPGLLCWFPAGEGNESSPLCHARLQGGKSIWLTGDGGFPSEEWLLRQGPLPTSDFLKVGHHGSRFSSGLGFLRATGAHTALVSVGKRNRYGHPAPAALSRLHEAGMKVSRTDEQGSLLFY